jgi:hypothetical protein
LNKSDGSKLTNAVASQECVGAKRSHANIVWSTDEKSSKKYDDIDDELYDATRQSMVSGKK